MAKSLTLILIFLLLIVACSSPEISDYPQSNTIIHVDPDSDSLFYYDELILSSDTLRLKTDTDLLRQVDDIKTHNNIFYLLDADAGGANYAITAFDTKGEQLFRIYRPGDGPGEYQDIKSYWITDAFLYVISDRNLIRFDTESGNYIDSSPHALDHYPVDFIAISGDSLLIDHDGRVRINTERQYLKVIDLEANTITDRALNFPFNTMKMGHSDRYFYTYDCTLSYMPSYENTLLRLIPRSDTLITEPVFTFEVPDPYKVPEEILRNAYDDRGAFFNAASSYIHTLEPYETDDFMMVSYGLNGRTLGTIYYKSTGESADLLIYEGDAVCRLYSVFNDHLLQYCDAEQPLIILDRLAK